MGNSSWYGEHGSVDDPDIFEPFTVSSAPVLPKIAVHADPDGVRLVTINPNTRLGLDEVTTLISGLEEARDYLEAHRKDT